MIKDLLIQHIDRIGRDRVLQFSKYALFSFLLFKGVKNAFWYARYSQTLKKGKLAKIQRDAKYSLADAKWSINDIPANSEEIVKRDVHGLREGLLKGEFTSVQLVKMYARKIMETAR